MARITFDSPEALAAYVASVQPVKAASPAKPFPFVKQFPCTAEPSCGRLIRTVERAAIHGKAGHFANGGKA